MINSTSRGLQLLLKRRWDVVSPLMVVEALEVWEDLFTFWVVALGSERLVGLYVLFKFQGGNKATLAVLVVAEVAIGRIMELHMFLVLLEEVHRPVAESAQ